MAVSESAPPSALSKLAASPLTEDWFIIHHSDGRIEDLGYVEWQLLFHESNGAPRQFQWRTLDRDRQDCVVLTEEDFGRGGEILQPYTKRRGDRTEDWYVGRRAHAFAKDKGVLVPPEAP